MHIEPRLWPFTKGVRLRIAGAVAIGLAAVGLGVARLALLGWLIGQFFAGRALADLAWPVAAVAGVMIGRGVFEYWRTMVAHVTAAKVQKRLRRTIYDRIAALGPGTVMSRRSGALTLSLIDGVEQLETYFGQFLPQFLIALLSPLLIFAAIAFIDLPVAAIMLGFAGVALFAPALWHRHDVANSMRLRQAYSGFAAEFLDSIQGLATLKAFGQAGARADMLARRAHDVFRSTLSVLATNAMARGITDSAVACGAAAALALGAFRVEAGALPLSGLLVILMLGVEIYRPMRELRAVLHQGMVGLSAAQGIYRILDDRPSVVDAPPLPLAQPLAPTLAFDDVRFGYPGTRRPVHGNLSFAVAAGERIGLVGASGGGKSSIVRLLLRYYDPDAGAIRLGGRDLRTLSFGQIRSMISVVNQDAFLFHGTVEENIRMGRPEATAHEIEAAARAANIHGFIATLPLGYGSVIGEKGVKLSGGQRQRLAIARAILRDAPILILDEALSAVDAENEALIQQALDKLMRGRTTLVLAHRLSSIIGCDRILVLDGGRIVESGRHEDLMGMGGVYARLMAEQVRESAGASDRPTIETREALIASELPEEAVVAPTEGIVAASGLGWFGLVVALMKLVMPWKGRLAATFGLGVARVLAFIGIGVASALVVRALHVGGAYGPWLVFLAVLAPLTGVIHWLESFIAHDMAFRLLAEMRIEVFRKLSALAPAYLVRRRSGDLMSLATRDIELIETFFAHTVAPAFVAILVPVAVVVFLAWQNPWLALALAPFLAIVGLAPFLMRGRVDRLGSTAREAGGELGAFAVDSIQGIGEIVAFQQEEARGQRLDALSDHHIRLRLPFFSELIAQQSLLEIMTGLGGLVVVATGGALAARGAVDVGLLPLFTLIAMAAFLPISEIAQIGRELADTLGATRRVSALAREPVPVTDGPLSATADALWHGRAAALALEDVGFAYPGHNRLALEKISADVPAGKTVALVGPSGAGKTTLAQLLMRFWDPQAGRITLNGVDLKSYGLDDLRRHVALVAQDTYLFNDTLRTNILMARPEASAAELAAAVEHAALSELVASLPDGLDQRVGERGTGLSGGQRQRVAIARAFLKDAPILILDEATSHLDALSEQAVRRALDRLKAERTTLVIAHRLSTVRDAGLILVLEAGRLVESGRHDELLARGGLYAQLVARQRGAAYAPAAAQ